jgi:hypothetical protein
LDEDGFRAHMKKKRKTPSTIDACVESASGFGEFLSNRKKGLSEASTEDLEDYVADVLDKESAPKQLWALQYYLAYIKSGDLLKRSKQIRAEHIAKKRQPFKLRKFTGVDPDSMAKLEEIGIENVDHMLRACRTQAQREEVAKKTGVSAEQVLELAKLSNLAQIWAVKSIRARLYYDAGIDSIEKMSKLSPEELRRITTEFIQQTGFEGIPPTPKEAEHTVRDARKLKDAILL